MKVKKLILPIFLLLILSITLKVNAQSKILDEFNSTDGWKVYASDGVELNISTADGFSGKCIRIDYNFTKGSGYGGIQKLIPIDFPVNFQFSFYIKAESPNNNLEFKLADSGGENVWWYNNRNYEFPHEWKKYVIKKRKIEFAWGPTQDKLLKKTERLEFTIASYNGGKGTIFIDELKFESKAIATGNLSDYKIIPSSSLGNYLVENLSDNDLNTSWFSETEENQSLIFDLKGSKEFGGLKIEWDEKDFAQNFTAFISDDNVSWEKVYTAEKDNSKTNYVRLPETESAFIKLIFENSARKQGIGIKEIILLEADYSADINRFLINIAKDFPRGYFPRYLNEEKSYWTIVGVNSDYKEALINEEGMVEVDNQNFSLEPFLFVDGKLQTWNDFENVQSLENNYLPIPKVKRSGNIELEVKAFADGEANKSSVLYLIYSLKNVGVDKQEGNFYVALRPFQVNPYYQWLNITGGFAKVKSIEIKNGNILVNNEKTVIPITDPTEIGATNFDNGEIITYLCEDKIPIDKAVNDENGLASAAIKYSFALKPQEEKQYIVAVPFYSIPEELEKLDEIIVSKKFDESKKFWEEKVTHIKFHLPPSADKIVNTIRTNLANILINRDNFGIQPGSRSYERSWIRDGALTSSALLKNGIVDEVKEYIEWYCSHLFENGKVPCVVDRRGPDPVPENDSHGEFIYLIKQFFNYTKDTTWLRTKFSSIVKTVDYMQSLINQRSTDYYKNGNDSLRAYYGILPESISHEGYSDKPRHSYWDSFWGMKGLKDAVDIAEIVGDKNEVVRFKKIRDDFKLNLYNSISLATKLHGINYIPGCVELGDFDATSTTIALYPCNERNNLPTDLLQNTFNRYWNFVQNRSLPSTKWDAYTPYEVRTIGSFIFLDQPERAHLLIDYFLNDQRPQGWNHWAEVVWKDKRLPRFIGDMPHTWVGSDFINSMRAMFVYENDFDSTLVIGAGLYQDWIDSPNGMSIENIPTYYGELSYAISKHDNMYKINLFGELNLPGGGIVIKNFNSKKVPEKVIINGIESTDFTNDKINVITFPATVFIYY
ncbi:MAG: discoidin domain-containing protein [bacterium]